MTISLLDVHSPRADTRPPWFMKGQSFGPVPHSRVMLRSTDAGGDYSFLNDGIVVPAYLASFDGTNQGTCFWAGRGVAAGEVWQIGYIWQVVDIGAFEVSLNVVVVRETGFVVVEFWDTVYQPTLADDQVCEQNTSEQVPGSPDSIRKTDIPEWCNTLEYYPDAHLMNIVF